MMRCYEIANTVSSGERSAVAVTEAYLARIEEANEQLGAFIHVSSDHAIHQAKAVDLKRKSGHTLGKLAGVPLAIKDNIAVKNMPMTCASRILEGYSSPYTATVVDRLIAEDAIILGKTNMDEFAMGSSNEHSAFFPARNPLNPDMVPGGSSGGSAVAVAANMAAASLGSETGGSVRQPAAFCGLVGFKPTYGRLSRYGLVAFGSSLDQVGIFCSSTQDLTLLYDVMAVGCDLDGTSIHKPLSAELKSQREDLSGLTFGYIAELEQMLSAEMAAVLQRSKQIASDLGASIQEVHLHNIHLSTATYYVIATAEAATNLARFDGIRYGRRAPEADSLEQIYQLSREQGFGSEVKRRIIMGNFVLSAGQQDAYYRQAQKVRALIFKEIKQALGSVDALLLPTTPGPAFAAGAIKDPVEMYLQDVFTIPANLCGMPAVQLPAGYVDKMPVGIQLMGDQLSDEKIIQWARVLEPHLAAAQ